MSFPTSLLDFSSRITRLKSTDMFISMHIAYIVTLISRKFLETYIALAI